MSVPPLNPLNWIVRAKSCESLDSTPENASCSSSTVEKVRQFIDSMIPPSPGGQVASPHPRAASCLEISENDLVSLPDESSSFQESLLIVQCKNKFQNRLEDATLLGSVFVRNLQEILDRDDKIFICQILREMLMAAGCGFAIPAASFPPSYVQLGNDWENLYAEDQNLAVQLALGALIETNLNEAMKLISIASF